MSTKEVKEGSKKSRETILDYVIVRAENVGTAETLIQRKRGEQNRLEAGREFLENFEKTRKIIRPFTRKKTTSVETKSSIEIKSYVKWILVKSTGFFKCNSLRSAEQKM